MSHAVVSDVDPRDLVLDDVLALYRAVRRTRRSGPTTSLGYREVHEFGDGSLPAFVRFDG